MSQIFTSLRTVLAVRYIISTNGAALKSTSPMKARISKFAVATLTLFSLSALGAEIHTGWWRSVRQYRKPGRKDSLAGGHGAKTIPGRERIIKQMSALFTDFD